MCTPTLAWNVNRRSQIQYSLVKRLTIVLFTDIPCISSLTVKFGPVVNTLDYNGDGEPDQVYVITGGGLGEVGLASAVKNNGNITFTPVCAGGSPGAGQSSFFFGLVSTQPPVPVTGTVKEVTGTVHDVQVRVPQQ